MSDTKVLTPEQIAELRAALAVLPMLSMLGGEGWPDTGAGVDWPLAPQSSDVPLPKGERPTIIAATPEIQRAVWMLRNAAPALLDAAERCAAAIARAEAAEEERARIVAYLRESAKEHDSAYLEEAAEGLRNEADAIERGDWRPKPGAVDADSRPPAPRGER